MTPPIGLEVPMHKDWAGIQGLYTRFYAWLLRRMPSERQRLLAATILAGALCGPAAAADGSTAEKCSGRSVLEQRLQASGAIPRGLQTPINTGHNRTSNRFQTGRNEDREQRRRSPVNVNKFLSRR